MGDSYRPGHHGRTQDHDPPPRRRNNRRSVDREDIDHRRSADHYDPRDRDYHQMDRYPPRRNSPPRGPAYEMRRFGDQQDFSRNQFSFGSRGQPQYPPPPASHGGRDNNYDDTAARRKGRDQRNNRNGRHNDAKRADGNGPWQRRGASERKLLQLDHGARTPPQLQGMNGGKTSTKYAEVISSDDEEDDDVKATDTDTAPPAPKWSNPEMYTALPPPDEPQRKRKDVVKLIRKSRLEGAGESSSANALASNDDFISLDFNDSVEEELIKPAVIAAAPPATSNHTKRRTDVEILGARTVHPLPAKPGLPAGQVEVLQVDSVGARLTTLKRKRNEAKDDNDLEYRQLQPPNKSLKRAGVPDGTILRDWVFQGPDKQMAVPWLCPTGPHRVLAKVRLHQEIMDFHAFVSAKQFEALVRHDLMDRLQNFMKGWPNENIEVKNFGSFAAGLYLPDADMDVCALSRSYRTSERAVFGTSRNQLMKVANNLKRFGIAESFEVIPKAKVPLVKFVDRLTSIKVDLSFENSTGVTANDTFQRWKAEFPAMPILVMVIKQFLLMRGLNDVSVGGIGGFSITCLVTSLLQHMPRIQTGEMDQLSNLGELLLEFLNFYGNSFNFQEVALRLDPPGFVTKRTLNLTGQITRWSPDRFLIIDPNKPTNDISGGSGLAQLIVNKFSEAFTDLRAAMELYDRNDDPSQFSLLGCMLGGNYDSFLWYRRHLRHVHEDHRGPVNENER